MERFRHYTIKNDNRGYENHLKYFKNLSIKLEIQESIDISGTLEQTESIVSHQYYERLKENKIVKNIKKKDLVNFINRKNATDYVSDQFCFYGNNIRSSTIFKYNTDE